MTDICVLAHVDELERLSRQSCVLRRATRVARGPRRATLDIIRRAYAMRSASAAELAAG